MGYACGGHHANQQADDVVATHGLPRRQGPDGPYSLCFTRLLLAIKTLPAQGTELFRGERALGLGLVGWSGHWAILPDARISRKDLHPPAGRAAPTQRGCSDLPLGRQTPVLPGGGRPVKALPLDGLAAARQPIG
jgi:hypothetical protein